MNSKTDSDNNWETRSYYTEAAAEQAWDDLDHKGAFSSSGGGSDGTGGEYEIQFKKDGKS